MPKKPRKTCDRCGGARFCVTEYAVYDAEHDDETNRFVYSGSATVGLEDEVTCRDCLAVYRLKDFAEPENC
jgi:hypothetical protein